MKIDIGNVIILDHISKQFYFKFDDIWFATGYEHFCEIFPNGLENIGFNIEDYIGEEKKKKYKLINL